MLSSSDRAVSDRAVSDRANVDCLSQQWAKRYVQNLKSSPAPQSQQSSSVLSLAGRQQTADKLMQVLRTVSVQAWSLVENLLAKEVQRHSIDPRLIDPWQISSDYFQVYSKTLEVYTRSGPMQPLSQIVNLPNAESILTDLIPPQRLATQIGSTLSAMRKKYTQQDPRVIGFVSMQFHYTSKMLLEQLSKPEQVLVSAYFKVIDDYLYMPLYRAYDAAALHKPDSIALSAVHQLLPACTSTAQDICQRVLRVHPHHRCYSGALAEPAVQISTVRDVEMFQVYLWVAALEGSVSVLQNELFPLCVMLYPTLKVNWELVRLMLHMLDQNIRDRLTPAQAATILPYSDVLRHMFSPEVFGELEKPHASEPDDLWESMLATWQTLS